MFHTKRSKKSGFWPHRLQLEFIAHSHSIVHCRHYLSVLHFETEMKRMTVSALELAGRKIPFLAPK